MSKEKIIDSYFAALEERDRLALVIESGDELDKEILGGALQVIDERLVELEADQEVSSQLLSLAERTQSALLKVDILKQTVDRGVIDEEYLERKRQEILTPRAKRAMQYIAERGLVEKTVAESKSDSDDDVDGLVDSTVSNSTEIVQNRELPAERHIQMTIRRDGIKIGKKGKFVKFSGIHSEGQADYSTDRRTILEVLAEEQGSFLSIDELWTSAFGDREFDVAAMTQIRKWLLGLTHRGTRIIAHNGKRGPSSAYGIVDFRVDLKFSNIRSPRSDSAQATVPSSHTDEEAETVGPTQEVGPEAFDTLTMFPADEVDSFILATYIAMHKNVLQEYGITCLDESLCESLDGQLAADQLTERVTSFGGDIRAYRKDILERLCRYFDNKDAVLNDVDIMQPEDPRYGLFTFLVDLNPDILKSIFLRLTDALPFTEIVVTGGKDGNQELRRRTGLVLPDGEELGVVESGESPISVTPSVVEDDPADSPLEVPVVMPVDAELEEAPVAEMEPDASEKPELIVSRGKRRSQEQESEQKAEQLRDIRTRAAVLLDDYRKYNLGKANSRTFRSSQMRERGYGFLSPRALKNASETGIIASSNGDTLSEKDFLNIVLSHEYPQAYSVAKSKNKLCRRDICLVIDQVISEHA